MVISALAISNKLHLCRYLLEEKSCPVYAQPFYVQLYFCDKAVDGEYRDDAQFINDYLSKLPTFNLYNRTDLYATEIHNLMAVQDIPEPRATLDCADDLSCRYAIRLANAIFADGDRRIRHIYKLDKKCIPMCFKNVVSYIVDMHLNDNEYLEFMSVLLSDHPTEYWDVDTIAEYLVVGPYGGKCSISTAVMIDDTYHMLGKQSSSNPLKSEHEFIDRIGMKMTEHGGVYIEASPIVNHYDLHTKAGKGFLTQLISMGDELHNKDIRLASILDVANAVCKNSIAVDTIRDVFKVQNDAEVFEIIRILLGANCCPTTAETGTKILNNIFKNGFLA